MPFGDGTGPAGFGPMTGRGAGYCAGYSVPGYMNPVGGRGFGMGRGGRGGRGRRNRFYTTGLTGWQRGAYGPPVQGPAYGYVQPPYFPDQQQEVEMLKSQADYLEKTLSDIRGRLKELESEKNEKA